MTELENALEEALRQAREAARTLALATGSAKDKALLLLRDGLLQNKERILAANAFDCEQAKASGRTSAFVDRLKLDSARLEAMARGVEQVAMLPDPVGEVIAGWRRPNGLEIIQVRVPLGVVAVIYESRPNVTVDAACLGMKAGNAVVLRGGSDAIRTNRELASIISSSLAGAGLPSCGVTFIDQTSREVIQVLKRRSDLVDLIIPRGGSELKQALAGSAVPVLPHFDGICHTYVDRSADLKMAEEICVNAKCSRPSVCNAMENLLVHRDIARPFLRALDLRLEAFGVEVRGCERTCEILPRAVPATDEDWRTEYLDLVLAVKVVDSLDEALSFINRHSSGLADAIVTNDLAAAERFSREIDSAAVFINASTRFTDGFEFGFGAETGISTHRLHARGPMGLRELTTYKYVVRGSGQVRL